jgi:hypothetical protein
MRLKVLNFCYCREKRTAVLTSRLVTKCESPFYLQVFVEVFLAAMNHFVTVETKAKRLQVPL